MKIFKCLHLICYLQTVFGYYFADNVGCTTNWTNFNYTCPRTICLQYLRILWSGFGEKEFHRFTLNLLCSNCLCLLFHQYCRWSRDFLTNFNKTFLRTICVQYLRILLRSFGEEDFQRFALNLLCSNCLRYYFADNEGGDTVLNKL